MDGVSRLSMHDNFFTHQWWIRWISFSTGGQLSWWVVVQNYITNKCNCSFVYLHIYIILCNLQTLMCHVSSNFRVPKAAAASCSCGRGTLTGGEAKCPSLSIGKIWSNAKTPGDLATQILQETHWQRKSSILSWRTPGCLLVKTQRYRHGNS